MKTIALCLTAILLHCLSACESTPPARGVTEYLDSPPTLLPTAEDVSPPAGEGNEAQEQEIRKEEEVTFAVRLMPISLPEATISVGFRRGSVTVQPVEGDSETIELSKSASDSLALLIKQTPKDEWKGFWTNVTTLDGYVVASETTIGNKVYSFGGNNGCPPGFASILMKINSVSGREIFSPEWEGNEANSEYGTENPFDILPTIVE